MSDDEWFAKGGDIDSCGNVAGTYFPYDVPRVDAARRKGFWMDRKPCSEIKGCKDKMCSTHMESAKGDVDVRIGHARWRRDLEVGRREHEKKGRKNEGHNTVLAYTRKRAITHVTGAAAYTASGIAYKQKANRTGSNLSVGGRW